MGKDAEKGRMEEVLADFASSLEICADTKLELLSAAEQGVEQQEGERMLGTI